MIDGHRLLRSLPLAALLLAVVVPIQATSRQLALLVGIGDYAEARDLAGPLHDVAALRKILIERWGFAAEDIVTLVDRQATRTRIMEELVRLGERSTPGDHILFYFSGHGTSHFDPGAELTLAPYSGAVLPYDAVLSGTPAQLTERLLVGRTDLRPVLASLDADHAVTVIYDSCFSGNAVRSFDPALPVRQQVLAVDVDPAADIGVGQSANETVPAYPYRQVFFLAAASEREPAIDIDARLIQQHPTYDGLPHGAFTDALLRVLAGEWPADADRDGTLDQRELRDAIERRLSRQQLPQTPQALPSAVEDIWGLGRRAVFSRRNPASPAATDMPVSALPRVHLDFPDPKLAESLQQRQVELVGAEAVADLTVKHIASGGYALYSGDGELIGRTDAHVGVLSRIDQIGWFQALTARAATANPFVFRFGLTQESCGEVLCMGTRISFNLETERPARVLLLDLDARGQVNLLYPVAESELAPLQPGVLTQWPAGLDGRPDPIQVGEPPGTDLLIAFAVTDTSPALPQPETLADWQRRDPIALLKQALADTPQAISVSTLRLVAKVCPPPVAAETGRCFGVRR